jgi:uncharacterized protein involved in exopolysaccharide biosynthesis
MNNTQTIIAELFENAINDAESVSLYLTHQKELPPKVRVCEQSEEELDSQIPQLRAQLARLKAARAEFFQKIDKW